MKEHIKNFFDFVFSWLVIIPGFYLIKVSKM